MYNGGTHLHKEYATFRSWFAYSSHFQNAFPGLDVGSVELLQYSCSHLLSASYMLGTALTPFHELSCLILTTTLDDYYVILLYPFHREENWGVARLSNLTMVIPLVEGRARTQSSASESELSVPYHHVRYIIYSFQCCIFSLPSYCGGGFNNLWTGSWWPEWKRRCP